MNNKKQQNIQSEKTLTEIFKYNAGGEASEYHIIIHSTKPEDTYEEQLNAVLNTYDYLLTQELKGAVAILKRYFLSDAANQADMMLAIDSEALAAELREEIDRDKTYSRTMTDSGEYHYEENYHPREMSTEKKIFYAVLRVITIPIRRFL